jgi:hypothetical protein
MIPRAIKLPEKPRAAIEIKSSAHVTPFHLKSLKVFHEEYPDVPRYLDSGEKLPPTAISAFGFSLRQIFLPYPRRVC